MCWAIAGSADFVAVGHFRDMEHYYDFARDQVVNDENVKQQRTTFTISRIKFDIAVEF